MIALLKFKRCFSLNITLKHFLQILNKNINFYILVKNDKELLDLCHTFDNNFCLW
jgi:hypothetical protein